MNLKNTAIYIHIPFCDHKCIYCDFYSLISYENIEEYLKALLLEIKYFSKKYNDGRIYKTIFFGGGTPSFMRPKYIGDIINALKNNFNVSEDAEITLETNPGTVSNQKLRDFRSVGINRLSVGIQSFDDDELKFLTRIHNKETAIKTVEDASTVGFENISVDLIFSLPKQTLQTWKENLEIVTSLPIKHISAYSLILEKGTILNKMVLDGKVKMAGDNHDAELYECTMDSLQEQGFEQYEVSNFAKKNYECLHNKYYWQYEDYLSFGTAAHSFVDGKRWWNFSSLKKYVGEVKQNGNAIRGNEILTSNQMLDEYIMLGLRSTGLNKKMIKNNFLKKWYFENEEKIKSFINNGYLLESRSTIKCTKKGYLVCDEIISKLL
ncbi:MAG: radical SAM family heme chaperone HemW [Melioribacteraceae bacterium]